MPVGGLYPRRMGLPFAQRLGGDLKRVESELGAAKQHAVRPAGLTVPQYAAMLVLSEHPGVSAAELARRCLVTPQTMTTVLRNLETSGLIERVPHEVHRNVLETRLTPAGEAAFEIADERAVAVERRLMGEFSAEELAQLRALLARCSSALT